MSIELIVASVAITCALVLYTSECSGSVVRERCRCAMCCCLGRPRVRYHRHDDHVELAQQSSAGGFGIHAVTGLLAIVLMLVHAVWATVTYVRHNERGMHRFHTFQHVSCGLRGSSRTSSACWWVSR